MTDSKDDSKVYCTVSEHCWKEYGRTNYVTCNLNLWRCSKCGVIDEGEV